MNILMVNKFFYRFRGAESYMMALSNLLTTEGYNVIPFCMNHEKNEYSPYTKYFVNNIDYYQANFFRQIQNSFKIIYSVEAKKKITKCIRQERPVLAHVHNIYHQLSPSILGPLKKFGLPIVMTAHDYKLICANYKLFSQGTVCERCKNKSFYHSIIQKCVKDSLFGSTVNCIEMYIHHIIGFYKKHVDRFIAPSIFMKNKLIECGIEKKRVQYIPHFIDLNSYAPKYEPGDYILFFGRLEREKGVFELIEAMKRNRNIKLLIVGNGLIKEKLKIESEKAGLLNILFLGSKNWEELQQIIRDSMFVVVPPIWHEVFGLTIAESFAFGKPVIGTNIGAISELIDDGVNGFLCEPGNSEELAEKISMLCGMIRKIPELGKEARKKIEQFYNKKEHINAIISVYNDLLH
jgi:glycosyltransferase involved in cell wall biosynthesis